MRYILLYVLYALPLHALLFVFVFVYVLYALCARNACTYCMLHDGLFMNILDPGRNFVAQQGRADSDEGRRDDEPAGQQGRGPRALQVLLGVRKQRPVSQERFTRRAYHRPIPSS